MVTVVELPLDLVDEIIMHLPPGDMDSLQNCSLVAKSWTYYCQKRLFEIMDLNQRSLPLWLDNISPTNDTLLGHVRQLSCHYPWGEIEPVHCRLRDYFPSFCNLTIFMRGCTVTKSGFITNHFPNLTFLDLGDLGYSRKYEPTPPLSRHHFKKLFVDVWCFGSLIFIEELSKLAMRFDKIASTRELFLTPNGRNFPYVSSMSLGRI